MRRLLVTVLVLVAAAVPGAAQPFTQRAKSGFILHAGMNGSVVAGNGFQRGSEAGSGATIMAGYGVTSRLTLTAGASVAVINPAHDSWIRHLDAGARYELTGMHRPLLPYAMVAYTRRSGARQDVTLFDGDGVEREGDLQFSGHGVTTGFGLLAFLNDTFACDVSLGWTFGNLSGLTIESADVKGIERHAQTTRFNLGVTWFPRSF